MKMDFITLACFFTLVTFTNGNQDCKRWEYSTPCEGLCRSNYYVLIDNICEGSWNTWECNGTIQRLNEPCNRQCHRDRCFSEDELSCERVPIGQYSCGGKCQLLSTPCEGLCSQDWVLIVKDNICENTLKTWECNGTVQRLNEPCNRKCRLDKCLSKDGLSCEYFYEHYSCDGKCQSWQMPCNGQCLKPLQLFDGACLWANELLIVPYQFLFKPVEKEIWECDGEEQLLTTPCKGECPNNLTLVMERCLNEDEFWVCDHVKQPISTSCYGLCSYITKENHYNKTEESRDLFHLSSSSQYHSNTTLGVYQKSKVIHNSFPVYYHTKRPYYIYVDKEGFWAVSNRIGFESLTLYRNDFQPTPEQPPDSGWKYRESISGTFERDSIGGNFQIDSINEYWQEDPGLRLQLQFPASLSRTKGVCPPKYCPRGEECCPFVWAGPNTYVLLTAKD